MDIPPKNELGSHGSTNKKMILVVGGDFTGKATLAIQRLKEIYGGEVSVYTPDQAKEQGLTVEPFEGIPKRQIVPIPIIPMMYASDPKSGRERRRERRKNDRGSW
jgi:hypothetical protein